MYLKILIIEDATTDRMRFRLILDKLAREKTESLGEKYEYRFAWNARKKEVWEVKRIIEHIKQEQYDYVLLDLAWYKYPDEIKINKLLFKEEAEEVEHYKENGKHVNELVHGFKFLSLMSEIPDATNPMPPIIVTSAYTPTWATGIIRYCKKLGAKAVFHKWTDEAEIEKFLSR